MTLDTEKQLLNYFTNKLTPTSPTSEEKREYWLNADRSKWLNYIPEHWNNFRYEGMIEGNELTSGLGVLYGGYVDTNNQTHGIITLVDQDFNPIKTFYKYSSGTDLRYIQYMKQAEDGSFYFVDDANFSYGSAQQSSSSEKRFVMINNITVPIQEEYRLNLRTSYIFPNTNKNFYCKNMFKDPNSSHYIFFGSSATNRGTKWDWDDLRICGLKVNVGEANEWTTYVEQEQALFGSAIALFDNDSNIQFRCLWSKTDLSSRAISCYTKTYTGNPSTSDIKSFNYTPYIDDYTYKKQSVFIDYNTVYFVQNNQSWGVSGTIEPKYIGLYKHDFTNNTNITLYEKYLGNYDYVVKEAIFIDKNLTELYINFIGNIDNTNKKGDYYIQRWNGTWSPILVQENANCEHYQRTLYVKNNFNNLQIYLYAVNPRSATWFYYVRKEDYNVLNYNGEAYRSVDMFIPKKTNLYTIDQYGTNNFIFGRNIYNLTIQDNMTMSSVEVPASYLNNYTINTNRLLSQTNFRLNNNTTEWSKNQYEVVDLNFLNTINIIDEDTGTKYKPGAIKLNEAITNGGNTNYTNTPCIKYRINYTDGTNEIHDLVWKDINDENKQCKISIYIIKPIANIDIISYDENTIYLTINADFMLGNYYSINQKVRVGEKPTIQQLFYNNEEVLYNNEQIMVYTKEE